MTAGRLMLLDTASLYFRSFYGVPDRFRSPEGTPVNAVRGLLDFITRLVTDYRPESLACCWDEDWRPQWRVDLIDSYKAHRLAGEPAGTGADVEQVPDPLAVQVPVIADVLAAYGLPVLGHPGMEADDVIGTLATDATTPVEVVTGDRDLFQLVDDDAGIRVLYTARGVGRHELVDEAWVRTRYGVAASQYAAFATLRGDSSDGLPGVPGIGEKTAATLLGRFGDVPALLAAARDPASDLSPSARSKIRAAADYLAVAPTVVAVRRDLDLGNPDLTLPSRPRDPEALRGLAERWRLGSAVPRLTEALARR